MKGREGGGEGEREGGRGAAGLKNVEVFGRSLQSLVLWNCLRLTEEGLQVLRCLPHVTSLSLRACQQLSDSAMPALASLSSLLRLDLRACERFTGGTPTPHPRPPLPWSGACCNASVMVYDRPGFFGQRFLVYGFWLSFLVYAF